MLDTPATIRQTAIKLLARREHSTYELRQKLQQKGAKKEWIEPVLQQLQQEKLLSDARFAEAYARMRAGRGYGPLRIQAELTERGIKDDILEHGLSIIAIDWCKLAEQVRYKKFGKTLPKEFAERVRQLKFLQYRGFTPDSIKAISI